MRIFDKIQPDDLERRELRLNILACSAVVILTAGTALFMYPTVFSGQPSADRALRAAFLGFCVLCILLTAYLWNRQSTIRNLRRQIEENRRRIAEVQRQASEELLKTIPNLASFLDSLGMEYRRTAAATRALSVLVISVRLAAGLSSASARSAALGDAARVVTRKLREEDSLYILGPACFGVVLPNVDQTAATRISHRIAEGLADAAGANNRFSPKIDIVNYPVHASSAHEMQEAVRELVPGDDSVRSLVDDVLA